MVTLRRLSVTLYIHCLSCLLSNLYAHFFYIAEGMKSHYRKLNVSLVELYSMDICYSMDL
jgi:hypothetical protein